jgi:hypothetical protein
MKCKEHDRYNCWDSKCSNDNAGQFGMDTSGHPTIGLGGGLALDLTDGDIDLKIGGITIDL